MMTLVDLHAGKGMGTTRIDMACGLTEFPQDVFKYADSLEILNLSNNHLSTLPDNFHQLKKLRILFLSENNFQVLPEVLAKCPQLSMVGFKSNQITTVPEHALPENLRWLILTDNQIEKLPASIGQHRQLQKLMLAGNKLTSLPEEMAHCRNLELLRISANQLESLPTWLLSLPKLSWLAFAGNPCSNSPDTHDQGIQDIHWQEIAIQHQLGEGASGIISKALWNNDLDIAVKVFKGSVTSDGFPADEMQASIKAGKHDHLLEVIGQLIGHPEQRDGLLLSLITEDYRNLANPPCLDSCTRDNYHDDVLFQLHDVLRITLAISSAAKHLHQNHINHGDLYGHNILINDVSHCLLGDFGAASLYHHMDDGLQHAVERLEVRAFGCLLEELLRYINLEQIKHPTFTFLQQLTADCLQKNNQQRPAFLEIHQTILSIQHSYKTLA